MGQKVSPIGLRIGVNKGWQSSWYANKKDIAKNIKEDDNIRTFIKKKYYNAAISSIEIERTSEKVIVTINVSRPGVVIGQDGQRIESIKKRL